MAGQSCLPGSIFNPKGVVNMSPQDAAASEAPKASLPQGHPCGCHTFLQGPKEGKGAPSLSPTPAVEGNPVLPSLV